MSKEKKEPEEHPVTTADVGGGSGGGGGSGATVSLEDMPLWARREVAKRLSVKDLGKLAISSKSNHAFFGFHRDLLRSLEVIVEGNPNTLKALLIKNPELLFTKFDVEDPAGQQFFEVSPFQLMIFLTDDRMFKEMMAIESIRTLIHTQLEEEQEDKAKGVELYQSQYTAQIAELTGGGADIVKLRFDPLAPTNPDDPSSIPAFEAILGTREQFDIWGDGSETPPADFPLLENPDGILFYQNPVIDEVKWYYADKEKRTIQEITFNAAAVTALETEEEKAKVVAFFNQFKQSCKDMETNSSWRSSMEKHELIKKYLCPLIKPQKGIEYTSVGGVRYRDTRFPFNDYYNKARQCFRFYAARNGGAANKAWLELGNEQKKLVWRLQFLCQGNLPFYPLPENFLTDRKPNKRELKLYGGAPIFSRASGFHSGLGSDFTIYKGGHAAGWGTPAGREPPWGAGGGRASGLDLIALAGLSEDAKRNIVRLLSISPESPRPEAGGCSIQ